MSDSRVKVGMIAFLASEVAFFGTLIMAYVYFLGQTTRGEPNPSQVFRLPLVLAASACLFSSSATIYLAERALRAKRLADVPGLVGLDDRPGGSVSRGNGPRVERADRQVGFDHEPEFVWNHLFHTRWFSCAPRDHWPSCDDDYAGARVAAAGHGSKPRERRSRLVVLAFRGWGVVGGIYLGLCGGTMRLGARSASEWVLQHFAPGKTHSLARRACDLRADLCEYKPEAPAGEWRTDRRHLIGPSLTRLRDALLWRSGPKGRDKSAQSNAPGSRMHAKPAEP